MRSLPTGTFDQITDPLALWQAWQRTAAGKRRGQVVARYALNADRDLFALRRELQAGSYQPQQWRLRIHHDPKPRLIAAPAVRDRIVHRALLDVIGHHFTRRCIDTHFTCGAGRGLHQAVITLLAMNRGFKWRLHLDIARYFPSIDHRILQSLLCAQIRDQRVCALIATILASGINVYCSKEAGKLGLAHPVTGIGPPSGPNHASAVGSTVRTNTEIAPSHNHHRCGLPLGSWFSQWAGAWYLDGLDHFVKRELKIPAYLRYMDDFVLLDNDRGRLADARIAITDWLGEQRRLQLNPKLGRIEPTRHPAVLLGHRISHAGITPAGRMRRRLRSRIAAAADDGPDALQRTLNSYRGLMWLR